MGGRGSACRWRGQVHDYECIAINVTGDKNLVFLVYWKKFSTRKGKLAVCILVNWQENILSKYRLPSCQNNSKDLQLLGQRSWACLGYKSWGGHIYAWSYHGFFLNIFQTDKKPSTVTSLLLHFLSFFTHVMYKFTIYFDYKYIWRKLIERYGI